MHALIAPGNDKTAASSLLFSELDNLWLKKFWRTECPTRIVVGALFLLVLLRLTSETMKISFPCSFLKLVDCFDLVELFRGIML